MSTQLRFHSSTAIKITISARKSDLPFKKVRLMMDIFRVCVDCNIYESLRKDAIEPCSHCSDRRVHL